MVLFLFGVVCWILGMWMTRILWLVNWMDQVYDEAYERGYETALSEHGLNVNAGEAVHVVHPLDDDSGELEIPVHSVEVKTTQIDAEGFLVISNGD